MNKTKLYHVSLSSHQEVMYRDVADLNMGFNCLAVAALETDSRLFAEGFMTTHFHCILQTTSLKELMFRARYAYTRYFNKKYYRSGRLGERTYFRLEIDGLYHTLAALNYVIRQGLHHGLAATAFGYPHGSANAFFRKDLGKAVTPPLLKEESKYRYLPNDTRLPSEYRMTADGLLLREDVLDVAWVEQIYTSARSFLYQMNRTSDNDDLSNQQKENALPPVTMSAIEEGVPGFVLKEARNNEYGKVNRSVMTDLELCSLLDKEIVPGLYRDGRSASIYLLSKSKREQLCESLWREYQTARMYKDYQSVFSNRFITEAQLRRCLCV